MPSIPFRDLPFFSDLFCDYVAGKPTLKKFFNGSFNYPGDIASHLELLRIRRYERDWLADVLTVQNSVFDAGEKTFAHIDLLRKPNTFAVVTGQQVGFLGGPLYTIYKLISTLQLCVSLRTQYPGNEFIPVFWLEAEDHDFAEANHTWLLDKAGALLKAEYLRNTEANDTKASSGPTGAVTFDDHITEIIDTIANNLQGSDFHDEVISAVHSAYAPGATFSTAFAKFLNALFPSAGIVFLNPMDRSLKEILTPVFRKELENAPRTCELVVEQSMMLEDNYHAQVKPRIINLFYFWKDGRFGIEYQKDKDAYWLKGTRQYFTREELFRSLKETPENFTPNVVLRPICQDYLLPTVMYVAGPGEIAYFAQFKPVYNMLNIPMPIIYPRASVTLLEEKFERILEKMGLNMPEVIADADAVKKKIAHLDHGIALDETLGAAHALVTEAFDSTRPAIDAYDKTLRNALETAKQKAIQALDILGEKISSAAVRTNTTANTQMEKLTAFLAPNQKMQERSLNIIYFLNKYGMDFCETLVKQIDLETTTHQVIPVSGQGGAA